MLSWASETGDKERPEWRGGGSRGCSVHWKDQIDQKEDSFNTARRKGRLFMPWLHYSLLHVISSSCVLFYFWSSASIPSLGDLFWIPPSANPSLPNSGGTINKREGRHLGSSLPPLCQSSTSWFRRQRKLTKQSASNPSLHHLQIRRFCKIDRTKKESEPRGGNHKSQSTFHTKEKGELNDSRPWWGTSRT